MVEPKYHEKEIVLRKLACMGIDFYIMHSTELNGFEVRIPTYINWDHHCKVMRLVHRLEMTLEPKFPVKVRYL